MEEEKFLIIAVCVTIVLVVSLITDCIKQRSKDRYWRELQERQNKEPPEYEYKDLGNGRGWLNQKK